MASSKIPSNVSLTRLETRGRDELYVVVVNGPDGPLEIGLIEKLAKKSRGEVHPWKAYAGIGNGRVWDSREFPACQEVSF